MFWKWKMFNAETLGWELTCIIALDQRGKCPAWQRELAQLWEAEDPRGLQKEGWAGCERPWSHGKAWTLGKSEVGRSGSFIQRKCMTSLLF